MSSLTSANFSGVAISASGQAFNVKNSNTGGLIFQINTDPSLITTNAPIIADTLVINTLAVDSIAVNDPPIAISGALIHVYDNDSSKEPQVVIEQDGTGDSAIEFMLTGGTRYALGIDNMTNNSALKMSFNTGGVAPVLGTNDIFMVDHVACNVSLGHDALSSLTTGLNNVAIGNNALLNGTSITGNVAIGCESLEDNTADGNTAVGYQSLKDNVAGTLQTAVGYQALMNVAGTSNSNTALGFGAASQGTNLKSVVAIGSNALRNTTTDNHVAVGTNGLFSNTTGISNTAVGHQTLQNNISGSNNVAIGHEALLDNTTGSQNIGVGLDSLNANTTGSNNTAVGYLALANNNADDNTAVGYLSLDANTTGVNNVAFGVNALGDNTTGDNNTALGENALSSITTGSNNTGIGRFAGSTLTITDSDNIDIGHNGIVGDNGIIRLGTFGTHVQTHLSGSVLTEQPTFTSFADANVPSLTMSALLTRIMFSTPTATRTWTLDTAANLVAGLLNVSINDAIDFNVINNSVGPVTNIIVSVTPGGTLYGSGVVSFGSSATFRMQFTNVTGGTEAYNLFRLN